MLLNEVESLTEAVVPVKQIDGTRAWDGLWDNNRLSLSLLNLDYMVGD